MLIIVPVRADEQFEPINKTIRTEDVADYMADVYDMDQCIISFYDERDNLTISEDFDTFHARFSDIEKEYYDLDDNDKNE